MTTADATRDDRAPDRQPPVRIPHAVWINRPTPGSDRMRRAAKALAVALLLGAAAAAAKHAATGPLLSGAVDTGAAVPSGGGPTGCVPEQFDHGRLASPEQPPTL